MGGILERMERRRSRKGRLHKFPLAEAANTMDLNRARNVETIDPRPQQPWKQPAFKVVDTGMDKEKATDKIISLTNAPEALVYSGVSAKKGQLGAAAVMLDQLGKVKRSWQASVGQREHWPVHQAQLIAICYALDMAKSAHEEINDGQNRVFTIVNDSTSALQAIASSRNKSGQQIVRSIISKAEDLREQGAEVQLLWIPRRSGIPGKDAADDMAKAAASPDEQHVFRQPLASRKKQSREKMNQEWQKQWQTTEKGQHLRRIDCNLPSKRTQNLYGPRQRNRAYLLTQLRRGHSWLATHARIHGYTEDDKCECVARETAST